MQKHHVASQFDVYFTLFVEVSEVQESLDLFHHHVRTSPCQQRECKNAFACAEVLGYLITY